MATKVILNPEQTQLVSTTNQERAQAIINAAQAGAISSNEFVFFAAFDGTNNTLDNSPKANEQTTNVSQLWKQYNKLMDGDLSFGGNYYAGPGTPGTLTFSSWLPLQVTQQVIDTAKTAYEEFKIQALEWILGHSGGSITVALTSFSRGDASAAIFSQMLYEQGLVDPSTGDVLIAPGQIKVSAGVIFDPVTTGAAGNLAFAPNVANVVNIRARNEYRQLFKASDYRNQPGVTNIEMLGNHCDIGGGYDNGIGALSLQAATAFFQKAGLAIGDVPAERQFDPLQIFIHDEIVDDLGRPQWDVYSSVAGFPTADRLFGDQIFTSAKTETVNGMIAKVLTLYDGRIVKITALDADSERVELDSTLSDGIQKRVIHDYLGIGDGVTPEITGDAIVIQESADTGVQTVNAEFFAGNETVRVDIATVDGGDSALLAVHGIGKFSMTVAPNGTEDAIDASGMDADVQINLSAAGEANLSKFSIDIAAAAGIENAKSGKGNDVLMGNDAANVLDGSAGNDDLKGGFGTDTLTGGIGNDTLVGDADFDTYIYNTGDGFDTIEDLDGQIIFDGQVLNGGVRGEGEEEYTSVDGKHTYLWEGGNLVIDHSIFVLAFNNDDLGLHLEDESSTGGGGSSGGGSSGGGSSGGGSSGGGSSGGGSSGGSSSGGDDPFAGPLGPGTWSDPLNLGDLTDSLQNEYAQAEQIVSPLVLDLDGDGIETISSSAGIHFDHDGNHFAETTGWVGKDDGLLVLDRNSNGTIDEGRELFGNNTYLSIGSKAADGFAALAELDSNHDGKIDAADAAFSQLRVWKDSDSNGVVSNGELLTLDAAGVRSLSLAYISQNVTDAQGNILKQVGQYTRFDGSVRKLTDVWFSANLVRTVEKDLVKVDPSIMALPELKAFGNVHGFRQAMALDTSGKLQSLVSSFALETDPSKRDAIMTDLMYRWVGVDGIDPNSRGIYIGDARKLAVVEAFMGKGFYGNLKSSPGLNQGPVLIDMFNRLKNHFESHLVAQTDFKGLYESIDIVWNAANSSPDFNVSAIVNSFRGQYWSDPDKCVSTMVAFGENLNQLGNFGKEVIKKIQQQADGSSDGFAFYLSKVGANAFKGGTGNDSLIGGVAADLITDSGGNNTIEGGIGNDVITSSPGADTYVFNRGDGQDTITDYGGSDRIVFGAGIAAADIGAKRVGNDMVLMMKDPTGVANDQITVKNWFGAYTYQLESLQFADNSSLGIADLHALVTTGTAGDDVLTGWLNQATLFQGFDGNDTIQASGGADTISGGAGDDTITDSGGNDTIEGGAGNDTITDSGGNDTIDGGAGNDVITHNGAGGTAVLRGGDGNDAINFRSNNNTVEGGAGDDVLQMTSYDITSNAAYANTITGGTGNDRMVSGNSADTYVFNRGDGVDTILDFDRWLSGKTDQVAFGTGIAQTDLSFSNNGNHLVIKVKDPVNPLATDQVTIENWYSGDNYRIELFTFADGSSLTKAQISTMAATLTATEGADTLAGWSDNNLIYGLGGDDTITDSGGNDTIDGGAGNDTITDSGGNDTIEGGAGNDTITDQGGGTNVLRGGDGNDTITFSSQATNAVEGGAGDDLIQINSSTSNSSAYANTIAGGAGNDRLVSGGTADTYVFNRGDGQDSINDTGAVSSGVAGVDKLVFGAGIAAGDVTVSRSGNHLVLKISDPSNPAATDQVTIENWNTVAYRIEQVVFADGTTWTTVQLSNMSMAGTEGDDTLTLQSDGIFADGKGGNDTITSGGSNAALYGGDGNDTITDSGGNDTIEGGAGNDTITDQGGGTNVLRGGDGNDTITFSSQATNAVEGGAGDDLIQISSTVSNSSAYANTIAGGAGNDRLVSGGTADTYVFNRGDGQDSINDIGVVLSGVAGVDKLVFGAGIAAGDVTASRSGNHLVLKISDPSNPAAIDQVTIENWNTAVYRIEQVVFADGTTWDQTQLGNLAMVGADGDDTITVWSNGAVVDGKGGNDTIISSGASATLYGGDGNDTITDGSGGSMLDGGAGADTLLGGAGNDVYVVDNVGDVVTEATSAGTDTVQSAITYTLSVNVENLTLTGTADINGTGNVLNNVLTGNAGNNTLDGGTGIDTLIGGAGDDLYIVDNVGDVVTEAAAAGIDTMQSSVTYTLSANVEYLGLTGTAAINGTGNANDNLIIGNSVSNTLNGAAGIDILQGAAGADTLIDTAGNNLLDGGTGNDTITGGIGNELIIGGAGNDTITTSTGADIIAFNSGDGQDIVNASTGKDNTLSLGNGIKYADLLFKKSANDLILITGTTEQVTFKDWYVSINNRSVSILQIIIENTSDYDPTSSIEINNKKVEQFNFDGLAVKFDQALAATPTLTSWALSSSLLEFYLSSSDTAAIGGDFAYQYAKNGNLSNLSMTPAQALLAGAQFGLSTQNLQTTSALQDLSPRLI
jgi:Ca2+-binding RTX toxin-like protein